MRNYHLFYTTFAALLFCSCQLLAQSGSPSNGSQISGKLLNESRAAVMYASVALLKDDSVVVNSDISTPTGDFRMKNVAPGIYQVRVEHLEYDTYISEPFHLTAPETKDMAAIILQTAVNELGEVVVTYRKPLIEVKADRLVFNVTSSPSIAGTNGLDLLRKTPGVSIDMDNNIALLGKSGVQIYINDKPSNLSGNDLVSLLQSIASDNVEAIEIISNPSAKYEAEGNAGIINILMKKNQTLGYNGRLASSFTQGRYLRYNNSLSLNYGAENLRANFEITQSNSESFDGFLDTKRQNGSILEFNSNEIRSRKGINIAAGIEKQVDENQLLSLSVRSVLSQADNLLHSQTDIVNAETTQLTNILLSQSIIDLPSQNHTANLNYQWELNDNSNLNAAISFGSFRADQNTNQPNTLLAADGTTVDQIDNTQFTASTNIQLWSAKTDYEREWENFTFSTGWKYSQISTGNSFDFYQGNGPEVTFDPSRSNDFNYTEKVAALYAILDAKLSPALKVNAGLRMENTTSRGQLISELSLDNKDVPRTYTDLFPNIGLSFDNQGDHSWNIGIGRRITRPNYQSLNPFEKPISQLTVWKGNPFLNPKYTMNYQATYSYQQRLVITNTYSVTKDFFANIFEITGSNSNQIIPRNMQKATTYGLAISYPLEVSKNWQINSFFEATHQSYNGNLEGTIIDLSNTNYGYRMQNSIKLPWDITLDLSYFIESGWIWRGSIHVKGNHDMSFGLRKYFFDKRLQISITGSDVFRTTNNYFYDGDYGGLSINGVRLFDTQRFGMGAILKFGNQQAKVKRKTNGALDDELNRIEN